MLRVSFSPAPELLSKLIAGTFLGDPPPRRGTRNTVIVIVVIVFCYQLFYFTYLGGGAGAGTRRRGGGGEAGWRGGRAGRVSEAGLRFSTVFLHRPAAGHRGGHGPKQVVTGRTAGGRQTSTAQRLTFHFLINAGLNGGDLELPSARRKK